MTNITKKRKDSFSHYDATKFFTVEEASVIVKKISTLKYDASIDLAVRLGVDPKKSNEMVRGVVSLPHGTGKEIKIAVICQANKEEEAKTAGADFLGYDDLIDKIKKGKDYCIYSHIGYASTIIASILLRNGYQRIGVLKNVIN
mgnify:CR=1 FL=1